MKWRIPFPGRTIPLGRRGETLAARWLRRRGYRIIARNLHIGDDEVDLLVVDPDERTIVIVEVKTRSSDDLPPETAFNRAKQFHLGRLAARLAKRPEYRDRPFRFDAIAIVWPASGKPEIRHHPGAFDSAY